MLELGVALRKNKDDPEKALQLLRVLDGKCITAEILIETLIGKALTSVNDRAEPGRPCNDTPDLLERLTKMKDHLKSKWRKAHADYKKNKAEAKSSKPIEVAASAAEDTEFFPMVKVTLPHIPGGQKTYTVGDGNRDMVIEKLITKLQTPIKPDSPQLSEDRLVKAIQIGKLLERVIYDSNKMDK